MTAMTGDMTDDDRITLLRRGAQCALGWANSLPASPWTAEENTYEAALGSGCVWEPDTYWVTAPKEPEETSTIALAYGAQTGDLLSRLSPPLLRSMAMLLNSIAGECEGMRRSALYLDVSDRLSAERLRRGPAGLGAAVAMAQALLGELPEIVDEEDDDD